MNRKIFAISIIVFIIDQVSKNVLSAILTLNKDVEIVKDFFYITLTNNYGAAWSILENKTILIIIGTLIALVIIYKFMYSFKMNKRNIIAFGILTGGILGNLIDRIIHGYVIDFLNFKIFGYNFPVFNIADVAIVCGIFLLIYAIIKGEDKDENKVRNK